MRLRIFAGLILCNVLWSAAYSLSKSLMAHYSPMELSFLRYFSGGIPLLAYCAFVIPKNEKRPLLISWARDLRPLDLRLAAVGMLTFFMSPLCQMNGLKLSRAIDVSLMIAIEPLITIILACIVLGERLRPIQVASVLLAIAGAGILTDLTWHKLISFTDARLVGNSIFLLSVVSEAAYSILAKPVLKKRSSVLFLTVAVWVGIVLMFGYNLAIDGPARLSGLVPLWQRANLNDWAIVLYLGLGCTLYGYLFWMIALEDAPVSILAVTLYVQPVLGVVWGRVFLGEPLTISTFTGGALIFCAVWLGSGAASRLTVSKLRA